MSEASGPSKILAGLNKLALVMRHQAWASTSTTGLNPTQAHVLALLRRDGDRGMTIKQIAAEMAVTTASVSDSIASIRSKGLVRREVSPQDARSALISLTAEGQRKAAAAPGWSDLLAAAVGQLDGEEQAVFVRGLVKMIRSLQESKQIPTSRMCVNCSYFRPNEHTGFTKPHHCNYVDAPIGDVDLRFDCSKHHAADTGQRERIWQMFVRGKHSSARAAQTRSA